MEILNLKHMQLANIKNLRNEEWKEHKIGKLKLPFKLYISNNGRVVKADKNKTTLLGENKIPSPYIIINGSYFTPQNEEQQAKTKSLEEKVYKTKRDITSTTKLLALTKRTDKKYSELKNKLAKLKEQFILASKQRKEYSLNNLESRKIRYSIYLHQAVAKLFVKQPSKEHCYVIHIDRNNGNNHYKNLKWVTALELGAHSAGSPKVIEAKKKAKFRITANKINEAQVKKIKQLLKDGKTLRSIATKFDLSDMQIHRIKIGENWSHVKI